MFLSLVKLSLFTHIFNAIVYFLGDDYQKPVSIITVIICICSILRRVPFDHRYPIPEVIYYSITPLYFIGASMKGGVEEDFPVISILSQSLVILIHFLQRRDLTIITPRLQRARARLTGCPGH